MNQEKQQALQALKTARGQIDGIIKMIEDGRYCIDISNQILASSAMLKRKSADSQAAHEPLRTGSRGTRSRQRKNR